MVQSRTWSRSCSRSLSDSAGTSQTSPRFQSTWSAPRLPPQHTHRPTRALGPRSDIAGVNTAPWARFSPPKPGLIVRAHWDRRQCGKQHRYLRDVGFILGQLYSSTRGGSQHLKSLYMIGKDQSYDSMRSPLLWVKVKSPSRAECKQWSGSFLLLWWTWAPLPLCPTSGQHHPPALQGGWEPACSQTTHDWTNHPLGPPRHRTGEVSLPTPRRQCAPQGKRIIKFNSEKFTTTHQDGPFEAELYFKKSLGWLI